MASAACWRLVSIRVMFEWRRGLHSIASIWPAVKYVVKITQEGDIEKEDFICRLKGLYSIFK